MAQSLSKGRVFKTQAENFVLEAQQKTEQASQAIQSRRNVEETLLGDQKRLLSALLRLQSQCQSFTNDKFEEFNLEFSQQEIVQISDLLFGGNSELLDQWIANVKSLNTHPVAQRSLYLEPKLQEIVRVAF